MYMYVHMQSKGMAACITEAEMQLNFKVLWQDRGREGLSESIGSGEVSLKLWQTNHTCFASENTEEAGGRIAAAGVFV